MINLKITKYRDFTPEEIEAREEYKRKNNRYNSGFNNFDNLVDESKYQLNILNVEISEAQWEAIRKAVLENF